MPSLASLSGADARGQEYHITEISPRLYAISNRPEDSQTSVLSFRTDAYIGDFVLLALSRLLRQKPPRQAADLKNLHLPKLDRQQQEEYVRAISVISPYESFADTTLRQFLREEQRLLSSSDKSAFDFISRIAGSGDERALSNLRQLSATGFQAYVEGLPHHLAVILRLLPKSVRAKDKFERLLHFFEAAAALHLDLLLSVAPLHIDEFNAKWRKAKVKLNAEHNLTLERSTFGCLCAYLESLFALLAAVPGDQNLPEVWSEDFRTLFSHDVIKSLRLACSLRNETVGHGGLLSEKSAGENFAKLEMSLNSYLLVTQPGWLAVSHVRCIEITRAAGGALFYRVDRLVGSNGTFLHDVIESRPVPGVEKELHEGSMYYYIPSCASALQSKGLVKLFDNNTGILTPYYYSKLHNGVVISAEFKCYHLDAPLIKTPVGDDFISLISSQV